jgi:hypothetical protein
MFQAFISRALKNVLDIFITNRQENLYSQENFLAIHKVQKQPLHRKEAYSHSHNIIRVAHKLPHPPKKGVVCIFPINEAAGYVDHYRVHTYYPEEKSPPFKAQDINNIIEQREQ